MHFERHPHQTPPRLRQIIRLRHPGALQSPEKAATSYGFVLAEPLTLLQTYALPATPPARAQTWRRIVSAGIFRTSKRPRRWSHSRQTRDLHVASNLQCKKFELCISRTNVSASEVCSSAPLTRNRRSFPAVSLIMSCCMAVHNLLLVYTTPNFCIQPQEKCKSHMFDPLNGACMLLRA